MTEPASGHHADFAALCTVSPRDDTPRGAPPHVRGKSCAQAIKRFVDVMRRVVDELLHDREPPLAWNSSTFDRAGKNATQEIPLDREKQPDYWDRRQRAERHDL